jgi:hypothetical protein
MVDHYGAPFFTVRGLELSGSSRKKWLLVASKPPITKLKDCPCSIYYGGELCSFRVVIYCMLAMGPGQLYSLLSFVESVSTRERMEREEKSFDEGGQINPRYLPYVFSE